MRQIGISLAEVDATKIIEDSDDFLIVPAIIAREGVFPYPEGKAYKPAAELKEAAWTAEGAWIVPEKHPDTLIVTDRKDIVGRVEKPFFCDEISGIKGNLRINKKKAKPNFVADVKSGKRKDVSIGFFYDFDETPGLFKGEKYDFVQRNILMNHVAAGVPVGRCRSPFCGIAVDSFIRKFATDPWEETEEYIRSGHKEASDTCRTIVVSEEQGIKAVYCKYGKDWDIQSYLFSKAKDWTIEKAKAWFAEHKKTADAANEMSLEEIKQKIAEFAKERDRIMDVLYPSTKLTEEEQTKLRGQLTVLDAQIRAFENILQEKIKAGATTDTKKKPAVPTPSADPFKEIERARRLLES
ncbi:MAG: DUF2213 domain-containing protein [Candidatus Bathyarchaeota archaeon]|nr:DUF2213 domain-containing protein [Candidatus Bathyarchaeota archaeon]MDH5786761.1 DUF2213 domain-containing protein [Candidatus Bathyarchaeota archaeon]